MVSLTGPLYRLYAWRLARRIRRGPVPSHVGIILDGNRRYARERGLADLDLAYGIGADKLDEVLAWCVELGIPTLSLWVLSTENLRRPPDEVSGILAAVEAKLGRLAQDGRIRRHAVRVRALGKLELLPDSTLAVIRAGIVSKSRLPLAYAMSLSPPVMMITEECRPAKIFSSGWSKPLFQMPTVATRGSADML